ncbi:MAG: SDR family NAD(P)-dependent oxidoreductase, partial [Halioglobus sp.]|nr:SDR family NAD(P)-dependent oxidoreductase [Halioglobus sp.]
MQRILITGANKGIGFATAKAILEHSDQTYVVLGSRDHDRGQAAVESLRQLFPDSDWRIAHLNIDVSSDASVQAAREAVAASFDEETPLYGVVNNAGIGLGSADMRGVVNVNTLGVKRVCDAFLPLLPDGGRVVNVASASGPRFVSECSTERQSFFQDSSIEWPAIQSLVDEVLALGDNTGGFHDLGLEPHNAYGFSKACVALYTMLLAREHPRLVVNACTPGYIETDLTRPTAASRGVAPADMGMKSPEHGTVAILHLLFGQPHGSG